MKTDDLVVVLPTTHLTLQAEKTLKGAGISHRTILKPRRISSDCGLAIRIQWKDMEGASRVLKEAGHLPATFYRSEDSLWEQVLRVGEERGQVAG
jgi:hypothetical protein